MLQAAISFALRCFLKGNRSTPSSNGILAPINLIAVGGLVFIIAAAFPTLSDEGMQRAKRWRRFASHLHYLAHRYPPAPRSGPIEMCLPYAASYGLAGMWADRFRDGHLSEVAAWFDPIEYGGWEHPRECGAAAIGWVSSGSQAGQ